MRHMSEEQLVLHHYGEAPEGWWKQHLEECGECRQELARLGSLLDRVQAPALPFLPEDYEQKVWASVRPRLRREPEGWRRWFARPRLRALAAVAALVLVAFLAGRYWDPGEPPHLPAGENSAPQRVLLIALGDHLERSQFVLLEIMNTEARGAVDLSLEQRQAEELVSANRLYRQTASMAGETSVAQVLEELERVLLQLANGPSELSAQELQDVQRRLEARGILFKMRVLGAQVRDKAEPVPAAEHNRT